MRELIDIYRFDGRKDKWVLKHDYELLQNFKFAGIEFYLTYNKGYYFVCTLSKRDNLYSLIYRCEIEGGYKLTPGEVVSDFRKQFLKHSMNKDLVEKFLSDPMKYGKQPAK